MLLRDRWDVIDGQIEEEHVAIRTETHVVHGFRAQANAQSTSGVTQIQQKRFSVAVDVAVVCIGVIDFARVLNSGRPSAAQGIQSVRPGAHVFRQRQQQRIFGDGAARLKLADETRSQGHLGFPIVPPLLSEQVVEVNGAVNGAHGAGSVDEAAVEVQSLPTIQGLHLDSVDRAQDESNAVQGVVNAQRALFIGAEDNAAAELLVKVTHGEVHLAFWIGVPRKTIAHTASLEATWKTEYGAQVGLVAQAGGESALVVNEVAEGIEACFFRGDDGAYRGVFAVGLPQHLHIPSDRSGF